MSNSNRLLVIFLAASSVSNPNPQPYKVARGNFKDFAALWEGCHLPPELTHPNCKGDVFIGHENDSWMKNLVRFDDHAESWNGTAKSGLFKDFLKARIALHYPQLMQVEVEEPATA